MPGTNNAWWLRNIRISRSSSFLWSGKVTLHGEPCQQLMHKRGTILNKKHTMQYKKPPVNSTSWVKKSKYSLCLEFSLKPGLAWAAEPLTQLWFLSYFWDILNILHVGLRKQIITCQQWAGLQTNCWKNKFKSSHPFFSQIWEPWNSTLHILSSPETCKGLSSDPKARLDLPGRIKLLQLCHLLKSSLAVTSCYATLTRGSTVPTCQTPSLHVLMP